MSKEMYFKQEHGLNVLNDAQIFIQVKRENWKLHLSTKRPLVTLRCGKWVSGMNRSQINISCKQQEDGICRKQVVILLGNTVEGISDIDGELRRKEEMLKWQIYYLRATWVNGGWLSPPLLLSSFWGVTERNVEAKKANVLRIHLA